MPVPGNHTECVSSENSWKSVLLRNLNCFNLNQLWLIPKEHDLSVYPRVAVNILGCNCDFYCRRAVNQVKLNSNLPFN